MGASDPEVGNSDPEVNANHPEVGASDPEVGASDPEVGASYTELGATVPGFFIVSTGDKGKTFLAILGQGSWTIAKRRLGWLILTLLFCLFFDIKLVRVN